MYGLKFSIASQHSLLDTNKTKWVPTNWHQPPQTCFWVPHAVHHAIWLDQTSRVCFGPVLRFEPVDRPKKRTRTFHELGLSTNSDQGLKQIKVTDKDACKPVHPQIQMGADTDIHWGG